MNLTELSELMTTGHDVLRVETRGTYDSDSDHDWLRRFLAGEPQPDVEAKRPWLERLSGAAHAGRLWRRLRVVPDPVTDYFRYSCTWSYLDNIAAGEQVRAIEQADWLAIAATAVPVDHYFVDGHAVRMQYGPTGRFEHAEVVTDPSATESTRAIVERAWRSHGRPVDAWWADHPELHHRQA